ncbi:B3/4 domain-containing protein [Comamonas testosteroni]|uniref:B3/B4 domain-containing protein n=1 Tax=Comamonas testosteroni TaxID=285 RepID=UPI0015FA7AF5|nr:phenylalanine--tRNA ligase beta subunit-related protein [Comamonas testosteroni]
MISQFCYSGDLIKEHNELHSMILFISGMSINAVVNSSIKKNIDEARRLLLEFGSESKIESIQKWRMAYRKLHTDPTKFRMAAESILRRLRTRGDFTEDLHPLVALCNSFSARYAIPVAALDASRIEGRLRVCLASGKSQYSGFDGSCAIVPAGEVTFEDDAGRAHARRWSHKQSSYSAISTDTKEVIIVAEALHCNAKNDLLKILDELNRDLLMHWSNVKTVGNILSGKDLARGIFYPFALHVHPT